MLNKCIRCASIWVCWNWLEHSTKWSHECWNCSMMWETLKRVTLGVPYLILKHFSHRFVEPGRFERQLTEDLSKHSLEALNDEKEDNPS